MAPVSAENAFLVKDISTIVQDAASFPGSFVAYQGEVYFAADTAGSGRELWRSDGTTNGTHLVRDICPGSGGGLVGGNGITQPVVFDGRIFFAASDCMHGNELWASDGTAAGTVEIEDLVPGLSGSYPAELTVVGSTLFFRVDLPYVGRELWKSDGTTGGTERVADVGYWDFEDTHEFTAVGSTVYFRSNDPVIGYELWKTDGTAAGTVLVKDIGPGWSETPPTELTAFGSVLLFVHDDGVHGAELWRSDGTEAGTVLVKDIGADPWTPGPTGLTPFAGAVYFAVDPNELWKTDGTEAGTVLVKVIGYSYPEPQEFFATASALFFRGNDAAHGVELWGSDGTTAGTSLIADIWPGSDSSYPKQFVELGSTVLFSASDGTHGYELWRTDGTAAETSLVFDLNPGPGGGAWSGAIALGSACLFDGQSAEWNAELWRTDGTAGGTQLVREIRGARSRDTQLEELSDSYGTLLFSADDGVVGAEPWASDGTAAGTVQLGDLATGSAGSNPHDFTPGPGGMSLFGARGGSVQSHIWKYDAGTVTLVAEVTPLSWSGDGNVFAVLGESFYFAAQWPLAGDELGVSQGTAATTGLFVDLEPGSESSRPARMTPALGGLVFRAWTSSHDSELWRTAGAAEETERLTDLALGASEHIGEIVGMGLDRVVFFVGGIDESSVWVTEDAGAAYVTTQLAVAAVSSGERPWLTSAGPLAYFALDDGIHGRELWVTDGTVPGTGLVRDIRPGPEGSDLERLVGLGDRIFFRACEPEGGCELWTSDGSEAGTVRVADLEAGPRGSHPRHLTQVVDQLYLEACTEVTGCELWVSDGTAPGTAILADIWPGPGSSNPGERQYGQFTSSATIAASGRLVYFPADDGTGIELWAALSLVYRDGFETGDAARWSAEVP